MVVIVRKPLEGLTTPDVMQEWRGVERLLHRRVAGLRRSDEGGAA